MIGFAMCGSFCCFEKALKVLENLNKTNEVIPIMSFNAYTTSTRFGEAEYFNNRIVEICNREIVHTLIDAEPLGPKIKLEYMCICPCTGNTLSKLANGIYDTPVTLAAKAHLRSGGTLIIALSTNDGLSGNLENISKLFNRKNVYFVPMFQDDIINKPYSLVCDFSLIEDTIKKAKSGEQIRPLFL